MPSRYGSLDRPCTDGPGGRRPGCRTRHPAGGGVPGDGLLELVQRSVLSGWPLSLSRLHCRPARVPCEGGETSMHRDMARLAFSAIAALALTSPMAARSSAEDRGPRIPDLKVETYTLPNGLSVIL